MFAFLEKLKDPLLVWEFQYYFGVRRATATEGQRLIYDKEDSCNDTHRVRSKHQQLSAMGQHVGRLRPSTAKSNGCCVNYPHQDMLPEADKNSPDSSVISNGLSASKSNHFSNSYSNSSECELTNGHAFSDRSSDVKDNGSCFVTGKRYPTPPNDSELDSGSDECRLRCGPVQEMVNVGEWPFLTDRSAPSSDSDSGGNSSSSNGSSYSQTRGDQSAHYVITKPFWYHLFSFGAALGDETFYSSFFPFWCWNIDGAVCRRVVTMWVVIMYIGQSLKDVIRWPRPASPPCIQLEEKWALEFGMPSTHAMVGAAVPFSFLFYTMYRYEYPVILGVLLCTAWCCVVCGSRLYLGMHTVLDIVAGLALSFMLLLVLIPCIDVLDSFTLTNAYSPVFILTAYAGAVLLIPSAGHWTPTRGDTVVILGVGAGIAVGSWLNYQWGIIRGPPMPPPYRILWPTYEMAGLTLLRTCIGILIVVGTRALGKSLTYSLACHFMHLDSQDRRNHRKMAVEMTSKFVTYMVVAFNITYLSPAVFRLLNIERVTMFTEI